MGDKFIEVKMIEPPIRVAFTVLNFSKKCAIIKTVAKDSGDTSSSV